MNFPKKIMFITLGCKVNKYETDVMRNIFLKNNYIEVTDFKDVADIYIVNSCTVTSVADKKSRNLINRAKKNNKNSLVILTGCYAQTNSEDLIKKESIDLIIDNSKKELMYEIVENYFLNKNCNKIFSNNIFEKIVYNEFKDCSSNLKDIRANLKIQDGCDNFCSYCKIPFARGKSRSRNVLNILNEVNKLTNIGHKEIILIGINLSLYGKDISGNYDLVDIINEISKNEDIKRIRLGSIYPEQITEKFIKCALENKKLMPHFHISIQSCDEQILKSMKRSYKPKDLENNFSQLLKIENVNLSADLIVGFPGEAEENYRNTYEFLKKSPITKIHVFPFSARKNTLAFSMKNKVESKISKLRVNKILKLSKLKEQELKEQFINKKVEILVEQIENNICYGYTKNYIKVKFDYKNEKINDIIQIKIRAYEKDHLIGKNV